MRKVLVSFAAVVISIACLSSSAAAVVPIGVHYNAVGPTGSLTIMNAAGKSFHAVASNGLVVASGVVASDAHTVPACNSGPMAQGVLLQVHVGESLFATTDKEWIWE